jgi:predicted nucleotidyltransferase
VKIFSQCLSILFHVELNFLFLLICSFVYYLDLGVYLVGSSANGFATEDTDADICIVISSYPVIIYILKKNSHRNIIFRLIKNVKLLNFLKYFDVLYEKRFVRLTF